MNQDFEVIIMCGFKEDLKDCVEESEMDDYYEDEEDKYSTCSIIHEPWEKCPDCCDFEGDYQPGMEECEFCSHRDACAEVKYGKNL